MPKSKKKVDEEYVPKGTKKKKKVKVNRAASTMSVTKIVASAPAKTTPTSSLSIAIKNKQIKSTIVKPKNKKKQQIKAASLKPIVLNEESVTTAQTGKPLNAPCRKCGTGLLLKTAIGGPNAGRDYICCETNRCYFAWKTTSSVGATIVTPNCDCGVASVARVVKKEGPNKGKPFFGCATFPGGCSFFEWDSNPNARHQLVLPPNPAPPVASVDVQVTATAAVSVDPVTDDNVCCVCLHKPKAVLFLPCAHLRTCVDCSQSLTKCPSCRAPIESQMKVYT